MTEIAAVGSEVLLRGFALAGVRICPADTPEQVRAVWAHLPDSVGLVILTPDAGAALVRDGARRPGRLTVVIPT